MYVNERSGYDLLTDPYQGEFGSFADPSDTSTVTTDAGGGTSVDESVLRDALLECGARGVFGGASAMADCVWAKLRELMMTVPAIEEALTLVATGSCSSALQALGLPSSISSIICGLGSDVWREVQLRAWTELNSYRAGRTSVENRPVAEGGGTVVRVEGEEPRIVCVSDADFGPTIFGMPGDLTYRCPAGTGGVAQAGEASHPMFVAKLPIQQKMLTHLPIGTTKPSDLDTGYKAGTATPWYKNKWVWIGAAAVAAVTGAVIFWPKRA